MATLIPAEREYEKDKSRIGELPDDILMSIISTMGMKEAAKTSILSKRWRYLWAQRNHLDFNHLILFPDSDLDVDILCFLPQDKKNKYINWVNQVVDLQCFSCIDTFRVCSGFTSSDAHHIDKWVRFALLRKVKNLELNLVSMEVVYSLTFDVLKPSSGVGDSGIKFLQSLYLKAINVSGDILEYLLVQCRLLERLHVEDSQTLVRWKVFGSSCKLKQLTIFGCPKLEELEIDALNLVYFHYRTLNPCTNVFKNMPMLAEALFGGQSLMRSTLIFQELSHLTAQISKLTLDFMWLELPIQALPTFCNLQQFTLMVQDDKFDLVVINQFLKVFPKLHEFTLEITWPRNELESEAFELGLLDRYVDGFEAVNKYTWEYFEQMREMDLERTNHPNLKEFKVIGFNGCDADVDLVLFLIRCTSNLETIICDSTRRDNLLVKEVVEASRTRAAKLRKLVPPKISLVIL